jgi:hypothetical protein
VTGGIVYVVEPKMVVEAGYVVVTEVGVGNEIENVGWGWIVTPWDVVKNTGTRAIPVVDVVPEETGVPLE